MVVAVRWGRVMHGRQARGHEGMHFSEKGRVVVQAGKENAHVGQRCVCREGGREQVGRK